MAAPRVTFSTTAEDALSTMAAIAASAMGASVCRIAIFGPRASNATWFTWMTGAARTVVERTKQVERAEAAQVYRMVCRRRFYE